jgi:small GTP-binding protein
MDGQDKLLSKRRLTICVVGSGGVGKSSLTVRFLKGIFPEFYDPTVEECYLTQYEYGFDRLDLEIIDTAGEEEFMMFRDCSMAKADAFLALFAINSLSSFLELKDVIAKIVREHDDDEAIPTVVIANKKDLDEIEVNFDDVLKYCNRFNFPMLETSAKVHSTCLSHV